MKTFGDYLREQNISGELASVLNTLADCVKKIALAIDGTDTGKTGPSKAGQVTKNVFGEEQIALDVFSNKLIIDNLRHNSCVGLVSSEELDGELKLSDSDYAVCLDPLDGSSLADVNLTVGTIIGIYKTKSFIGVKGNEQVAAMVGEYGPSTLIFLTVGSGVAKFILDPEKGEFNFAGDGFKISEGKMFAPGNLRSCKSRADYLELINYWCKEQYTLRYSGGMVPDILQIILKGQGIFSYPGYEEAKDGKLRLLFECAPMSMLVEQAGGASSDGKMRILDKPIMALTQRTPIFIGSRGEVDRCNEMLNS